MPEENEKLPPKYNPRKHYMLESYGPTPKDPKIDSLFQPSPQSTTPLTDMINRARALLPNSREDRDLIYKNVDQSAKRIVKENSGES